MVTLRPATRADLNWLASTFLVAMRTAITAARGGGWEQVREREQFFDQLRLEHTQIASEGDTAIGFLMLVPHGHVSSCTPCAWIPRRKGAAWAHRCWGR